MAECEVREGPALSDAPVAGEPGQSGGVESSVKSSDEVSFEPPPRFAHPQVQSAYLRLKAGEHTECLQLLVPLLTDESVTAGKATALLVAGVASAQLGHLETASQLLQDAERLGFVERDLDTVGTAARELARLLVGWGHWPEAKRRLEQAIEMHKLVGSHQELAFDLVALGQLRKALGYEAGAADAVKEAVAVGLVLTGEAFPLNPESSELQAPPERAEGQG